MQAKREELKGYIYSLDDEIQKQFESDFEYELTNDQERAINDIKLDMEKGLIIDRLVCGDVGYGKTEVAIRIAMKTYIVIATENERPLINEFLTEWDIEHAKVIVTGVGGLNVIAALKKLKKKK